MLQDRLLIRKFRDGDRQAFRQLYEKYVDDLLSLATYMLIDRAGAEDVVQDVFVQFVQNIGEFRLKGSLKSYLSTCVANRVRDRMRQAKRRATVSLDEAYVVTSTEGNPVRALITSEDTKRLQHALVQLPYEQKEVILLRLHGEMKYREIAQARQVSTKTVLSRYRYGLDKLRALLNSELNGEVRYETDR
ncbi:MAG: sigma-70 family RNA polymerase sigma factor [Sedimentisphaerales bacterium]|nr:sigma-70 family RNA polymerase sigma factor [Sedimentisphaerales bacterium]